MKKVYFLILLLVTGLIMHAQDLDKIKNMLDKSQFKEAKQAIDKYLSDSKNAGNAEAWYYKGRAYNSLSADKTLPDSVIYNLKMDASNAFKKNQQLDPKDLWLFAEGYTSYLDLYFGFYDLGAKEYNDKNYAAAFQSFKQALEIKDYILNKKYSYTQVTLFPLDTALVSNTAKAAIQAKMTDEGIQYYKKITDANVSGKDYEEVYEFVIDYYSKKDDQANLQSLLEKAKRLYPKNEFWSQVELNGVSKKGDKSALFAKYDEMLAKDPGNFTTSYNYAIELYNSIYGKDAKTTNDLTAKNRLTEVLKIAINNEKESEATVLMTNHLFNMSADLLNGSNAIKSTKPEDVKKKTELKALANKTMDECIVYAEKASGYFAALPTLKPVQKANYKIVLGYLYDIYTLKNNTKKANEYDAKGRAVDKL